MKSKLTIDLDENNSPIIVVNNYRSDDLRDKVVTRLFEALQHQSSYFVLDEVAVYEGTNDGSCARYSIKPVSPSDLEYHRDRINSLIEERDKLRKLNPELYKQSN